MSGQQGSVRKRKDNSIPPKGKDASTTAIAAPRDADLDVLVNAKLENKATGVEWDFRIALAVITLLAFVTRFWGISHPNEVVFDEVHFGKVNPVFPHTWSTQTYLPGVIVCFVLSPADILLRCAPSVRKTPFRLNGMVCGL